MKVMTASYVWNLVWVILPFLAMTRGEGHTAMALPPGCLCTMFQCCDEEAREMYDCTLFDMHADLMAVEEDTDTSANRIDEIVDPNPSHRDKVCQRYLNGTMDVNMTVCDAIINDEGFKEQVGIVPGNPGASSWSFMVEYAGSESCDDLIFDECPAATNYSRVLSWSSLSLSSCSSISTTVDGTEVTSKVGCDKKETEGQVEMYTGTKLGSGSETCPENPNLFFNEDTSNGVEGKRWMCKETTFLGSDGNTTSVRSVYTNLAALACYLEDTSTPTPGSTPSPNAPPGPDAPTAAPTSDSIEVARFAGVYSVFFGLVLGLML